MASPVRFRSDDRDRQTDTERMSSAFAGLTAAAGDVEREIEGLGRRLEGFRAQTAALLGNEDGIYFQREPAEEAMLKAAETEITRLSARLDRLREQRTLMANVLEVFSAGLLASSLGHIVTGRNGRPPPRSLRLSLRGIFRALGYAFLALLVFASLSPVEYRPILPGLTADVDRFIVYFATALAFSIGYPGRRRTIVWVGIAIVLGLEASQLLTGTRHAAILDALVKIAGVVLGALSTSVAWFAPRLPVRQ